MINEESISHRDLTKAYQEIDDKCRNDFDRSLPLSDALVDRWDRAKGLGFGEGSSVYGSSSILGTPNVGENVWIGPNTYIEAINDDITIGDWSILSANVQIYTHHTVLRALTLGNGVNHVGSVRIGRGCYIGPNVLIEAGTVVGDFCIIGAMSFVRGVFSDRSFISGIPAKLSGHVEFDNNSYRIIDINQS